MRKRAPVRGTEIGERGRAERRVSPRERKHTPGPENTRILPPRKERGKLNLLNKEDNDCTSGDQRPFIAAENTFFTYREEKRRRAVGKVAHPSTTQRKQRHQSLSYRPEKKKRKEKGGGPSKREKRRARPCLCLKGGREGVCSTIIIIQELKGEEEIRGILHKSK